MLQGDAQGLQLAEGISCAVSDGKNHPVTGNFLIAVYLQAGELSLPAVNIRHLGPEAHLPTQGTNPMADILHHCQKHVRPHMGLGIKEDVLPCPGGYHLLQNPADSFVVHPGVQLSIGEGAGAPLSELHVASFVQLPLPEEGLHLFMAGGSILSPLQHQRLQSCQSQHQSGKHSGRAEAHHHRGMLRLGFRLCYLIISNRGNGRPLAAASFENLLFAAVHRHINGIHNPHLGLFPGVHGTTHQLHLPDFGVWHLQKPGSLIAQLGYGMLRGHGNFPNPNHTLSFPA